MYHFTYIKKFDKSLYYMVKNILPKDIYGKLPICF